MCICFSFNSNAFDTNPSRLDWNDSSTYHSKLNKYLFLSIWFLLLRVCDTFNVLFDQLRLIAQKSPTRSDLRTYFESCKIYVSPRPTAGRIHCRRFIYEKELNRTNEQNNYIKRCFTTTISGFKAERICLLGNIKCELNKLLRLVITST